ncbi:hypothetical protein C8R45DRAFT_1137052, partial [Mycena sanguinolenta]
VEHLLIQRLSGVSAPSLRHLRIINCSFFVHNHRGDESEPYKLDLHMYKFTHLHTLTLDIGLDGVTLPNRLHLLFLCYVVFLPVQKLALILNLFSNNPRHEFLQEFAGADGALAARPSITSVKVVLWHWISETSLHTRNELLSMIDVSDEYIQRMPLLANKLAGSRGLRILKSTPVTQQTLFKQTLLHRTW